jgi:hypothetical protein
MLTHALLFRNMLKAGRIFQLCGADFWCCNKGLRKLLIGLISIPHADLAANALLNPINHRLSKEMLSDAH